MHLFDPALVLAFSFTDGTYNADTICLLDRDVGKGPIKAIVDVTLFEIVVVDLDGARETISLRVDHPGGLPLTAPEVAEVSVDAADIDLQVAILVEAKGSASCSISVISTDVLVDRLLDTGLVGCPLLVKFLGEITRVANDCSLHRVRVK